MGGFCIVVPAGGIGPSNTNAGTMCSVLATVLCIVAGKWINYTNDNGTPSRVYNPWTAGFSAGSMVMVESDLNGSFVITTPPNVSVPIPTP
jgi:hypothetical protein